jgi:WD40 repeat protein/DNA-binding SARP family transcriptional activator/energy-coupling factor transporter ATP-binding protein EcfA2
MATPGIAVLGPLAVNGDTEGLSPRDRVVLTALAIDPGEVVSAAALAEALWQDRAPASWKKVVQGCVLRLRQALGPKAIETVQDGYRLTEAAGDVDSQVFQRLLNRGRELLAVGQPERARYTLDEALSLWRGKPLTDLECQEAGRIEAARLTELNLQAQECRLRAALEAGRHEEVLTAAEAAVARAPLREQRWAMLAHAQYRVGRQADALRTLRRARTVLQTELGLDPGVDLVELEHSILRQDPRLSGSASRDASAVCPYPGLLSYDVTDSELFFGREAAVTNCLHRLETAGVLAVVGPSGSGKSSLLRAGVAAALVRTGRRPAVVTPGSRPATLLADSPDAHSVLVVDQFEEVFTLCTDPDERRAFLAGLVAEAADSPVILSLRADRLGAVVAYPDVAGLVERGLYLLGPMCSEDLRAAITGPAEAAGLLLEPGLVDLLIRDVEGQPGALPLLSHALRRTWERREGRTLTVAGYRATGGVEGCIAQSAEQLYTSLSSRERPMLRQILLRLVSTGDDGEPVRNRVPRRVLLSDPERESIVEALVTARLVSTDRDTVQIAHECLTTAWPRLMTWLDEDVEGQRILRHLTASADAWDAMGRPDSELYRGARLAKALEWRQARTAAPDLPDCLDPDLTAIERDFLAASDQVRDAEVRAAQQRARQQTRARRRTGLLLTAGFALLIVALVAGLVAVRQQHQREAADIAAAIGEAKRVDDAARAAGAFDASALLALEANKTYDSPETRGVISNLLQTHPALIRSLPTRDPVESLAVSPDGRTLLVSEDLETVRYRTDTMAPISSYSGGSWTTSYRADGRQLLVVGRGDAGIGEQPGWASAAVTEPRIGRFHYLPAPGVKGIGVTAADGGYSADGRFLTVYMFGYDQFWTEIDWAVMVWDVEHMERPVLTRHTQAFAVELSPNGRLLYVATQEPALTVIDVRTGRTVASVALPGVLAIPRPDVESQLLTPIWGDLSDGLKVSPDGKTLAVAELNDVGLYDAATLTKRTILRGHSDLVRSLQFSHDGSLLAAGAADHTTIVWDLATGGAIQTLTGHADTVTAVTFAKDDSTLYTGGLDKHVLVWDLDGRKQLVARIVDGEIRTRVAATAIPSPGGNTVVYTGSTSKGDSTRFLDLRARRMTDPVDDRGGAPIAAWLPPDYRHLVTAAGPVVKIWDAASGATISKRILGTGTIVSLAAGPDGRSVIVADSSGAVRRADVGTLASGPAVHFDHRVVAVAAVGASGTVVLLDDTTYAVADLDQGSITERGGLGFRPSAAQVSSDGRRLAVGGSSGEVGLFDLESREWLSPPSKAHRMFVSAVSFAPDGRTFVTSSFDGGVSFSNGIDGTLVAGVQVGQDESPAVATMTPDGHTAVVATTDGAVYRIDSRFEQWMTHVCAVVGRDLTVEEWRSTFGARAYRPTCSAA